MLDVEPVILEELDRLAPLDMAEEGDWALVVRNSRVGVPRTPDRRRSLLVAIVAAIAIAAPAYAYRGSIVDFFTADRAPSTIVRQFGSLEAELLQRRPGNFPRQARKVITEVGADGRRQTLYVAPLRGGGFCSLWGVSASAAGAEPGPDCITSQQRRLNQRPLLAFGYGAPSGYAIAVDPAPVVAQITGILRRRGLSVRLRFADGSSAAVPVVWVTAPISAGFFFEVIPKGRQHGPGRPVSVVVQSNGKPVESLPLIVGDRNPLDRLVTHQDRWGRAVQMPEEAIWSRRRLLIAFFNTDNSYETLMVMPSRLGSSRICVLSNFEGGCELRKLPQRAFSLQLYGGGSINGIASALPLLVGRTGQAIARIVLHYQDGAARSFRPKDGFVLRAVDRHHLALGHRLVSATGVGGNGRAVATIRFDPDRRGVYPCVKPTSLGYGVEECP